MRGALAEVWREIEGAVSAVRSATREQMPLALAAVVDLLVGETIPRMRAEAAFLLPLIAALPQVSEG
ncbi:hypothetical protein EPN29_10730 [bacterium]|nr:MAG: hypothetical protein EPN29_10730 [bacterium]